MNAPQPDKGKTDSCCTHGKRFRRASLFTLAILAVVTISACLIDMSFGSPYRAFSPSHSLLRNPTDTKAISTGLQRGVASLFKRANASDTQMAQADAIVKGAMGASDLEAMLELHRSIRSGILASLSAPVINRVELERLRTQAIARVDADSKRIALLAADLADILTPSQRRALARTMADHPGSD